MNEAWDPESFDRARDTMAHRGPDASGSRLSDRTGYALGHRRLSILDLTEAGNQPMHLDGLSVVFNGELYNYPDLKILLEKQGCVFRTQCDTEVLLHGYRVWGEDLPKQLVGMFAFCLWDEDRETLFAARDHAGQKPFFYYQDATRFIAASEPKAIFSLLGGRPPTRREAFKEFLIYDDIPDPYTWYKDLFSLPPGHCLRLRRTPRNPTPDVRAYWDFQPPERPLSMGSRKAREILHRVLDTSVRMHQLADVEVGAFLSGGLDSSGIVALACRSRSEPLRTYSIGYEHDEGELPLARLVAEQYGCRHVEHRVSMDGLQATFERVDDLFDMPFGDSSQFPTYEVARLAAQDVKVALTGDGGDEIFGGYWHMAKFMGIRPLDTSSPGALVREMVYWRRRQARWHSYYNFAHGGTDNAGANRLLGPALQDLHDYDGWWFYKQHWIPELDPFRRAQWSDFKCYLPTVLKKVDRCTMRNSLEARCPLLHPELIELMFKLSTSVRNPRGRFKHLYVDLLHRRRLVPEALFTAEKQGFSFAETMKTGFCRSEAITGSIEFARREGVLAGSTEELAGGGWGRAWRLAVLGHALNTGRVAL